MSTYIKTPKIEITETITASILRWEVRINDKVFKTYNTKHEAEITTNSLSNSLGLGEDITVQTEVETDTRPLLAYTFSQFDHIIEVKEYLVLAKDVQSAKELYDAGYAMQNDSWFLYDKSLQDAIALYGEPRPEVAIASTITAWKVYCNEQGMK